MHRHLTNMLNPFTMPDTVCQLNVDEFAGDLFTVDDINNDAIFTSHQRPSRFVIKKYVNFDRILSVLWTQATPTLASNQHHSWATFLGVGEGVGPELEIRTQPKFLNNTPTQVSSRLIVQKLSLSQTSLQTDAVENIHLDPLWHLMLSVDNKHQFG